MEKEGGKIMENDKWTIRMLMKNDNWNQCDTLFFKLFFGETPHGG